jgi:hypothetical protein
VLASDGVQSKVASAAGSRHSKEGKDDMQRESEWEEQVELRKKKHTKGHVTIVVLLFIEPKLTLRITSWSPAPELLPYIHNAIMSSSFFLISSD